MKHIIYTSDVDTSDEAIKEYRDDYCEPDENLSDQEIIDRLYEDNADQLDVERENLKTAKMERSNTILVVGVLGLWNGQPMGYKLVKSEDLSRIFNVTCGDFVDFYADVHPELGSMEVQCRDSHHDGTNMYVFRELDTDYPYNDDASGEMLETIATAGKDKEKQAKAWELVKERTYSLYPYAQSVYGWVDE